MPERVHMSEIEIITDGGRRRRWSASEKLRIVEETLEVEILKEALDKTRSKNGHGGPAVDRTAGREAPDLRLPPDHGAAELAAAVMVSGRPVACS